MVIYGINPVVEALRAGRAKSVTIGARKDARVNDILRLAADAHVPVMHVEQRDLERMAGGMAHQGVLAEIGDQKDLDVADLIAAPRSGAPLIVVLDGIEDPHNFGAILRSVDAAGADGVVKQARRSAAAGVAAGKASAGAIAHVPVATVVNIARALDELKDAGVWTVGLAGDGAVTYDKVDFTLPTALVLGAEGTGLRRLVREKCDVLASIPMSGHVESLNVSVAAGIVLFEATRQRRVLPRHP